MTAVDVETLHTRPRATQSLADRATHLVPEWNVERNGELTPHNTSGGSDEPVWWQCTTCSHEWKAAPRARIRGSGCPPCAFKKNATKARTPKAGQSFADRSPHLILSWHPIRNGTLTPWQIKPCSSELIWWICPDCNFEWEAPPARRTFGKGCPACGRKKRGQHRATPLPRRSLADTHPHLLREWHPTRNGALTPTDLRPGSNRAVWWICQECQHEWERRVKIRAGSDDGGCPECRPAHRGGRRQPITDGTALSDAYPEVSAEWHPIRNEDLAPNEVTYGSDHMAWWQCQGCGHEWQARVHKRTSGKRGCPPCANAQNGVRLRVPKPGRSLAALHPYLVKEWDGAKNAGVTPDSIRPTTRDLYWWCDEAGHRWQESPLNRTRRRTPGCTDCGLWGTSVEEIRLRHELIAAGVPAAETPVILGRFRNGRPLSCDIVCETWRVAIDFDGHRFHRHAANVARDTRKTAELVEQGWTVIRVRENLPPIGPHDVAVKLNSSELDRAKAVLAKLVELGFQVAHSAEYIASTFPWATRESTWASQVRIPADRTLAATHPELAAEWHPTKNGALTPSRIRPASQHRIWWLCSKCGREWSTLLVSRTSHTPARLCRCGRPSPGPAQPMEETTPTTAT